METSTLLSGTDTNRVLRCPVCGKRTIKNGKKRFCSSKCYADYFRNGDKSLVKMRTEKRLCRLCKKPISIYNKNNLCYACQEKKHICHL